MSKLDELKKKLKRKKEAQAAVSDLDNIDKHLSACNPKNFVPEPSRPPVREIDWTCPECNKVYKVYERQVGPCNSCVLRRRT